MEVLGMLLMTAALAALEQGHATLSAVLAGLGMQVKLLPGLIALAWSRRYRAPAALAASLAATVVLLPYRDAGRGLIRSLLAYASHWRFNETLHAPLAALLGPLVASGVGTLAVAGAALVLAWRRVEPAGAALVVVALFVLLAPSVFPWYALWLLPLLTLRDAPAALLFPGTVGLAYLVDPEWQSGERGQVGWGIRALEYLPCLLVALVCWARRVPRAERTHAWPATASSSS